MHSDLAPPVTDQKKLFQVGSGQGRDLGTRRLRACGKNERGREIGIPTASQAPANRGPRTGIRAGARAINQTSKNAPDILHPTAMSFGKILTLSSGTPLPQIGLGTWQSEPKEVENAVHDEHSCALKIGG